MSMSTVNESDQRTALAAWLSSAAFDGVPPLSSASALAGEYLLDQSYRSADERADRLVRQEINRHYTTGFLAGFGQTLALPFSISRPVAASWVVATRIAGAVAGVYRHSLDDATVRAMVLLSLAPDSAHEALREIVPHADDTPLQQVISLVQARHAPQLQQHVANSLLSMSVNWRSVRGMLVAGHSTDEIVDISWCYAVARCAIVLFRRETVGDCTASSELHLFYSEGAS